MTEASRTARASTADEAAGTGGTATGRVAAFVPPRPRHRAQRGPGACQAPSPRRRRMRHRRGGLDFGPGRLPLPRPRTCPGTVSRARRRSAIRAGDRRVRELGRDERAGLRRRARGRRQGDGASGRHAGRRSPERRLHASRARHGVPRRPGRGLRGQRPLDRGHPARHRAVPTRLRRLPAPGGRRRRRLWPPAPAFPRLDGERHRLRGYPGERRQPAQIQLGPPTARLVQGLQRAGGRGRRPGRATRRVRARRGEGRAGRPVRVLAHDRV